MPVPFTRAILVVATGVEPAMFLCGGFTDRCSSTDSYLTTELAEAARVGLAQPVTRLGHLSGVRGLPMPNASVKHGGE